MATDSCIFGESDGEDALTPDPAYADAYFGHFHTVCKLGQGKGGGAVYLVEHVRSQHRAAAKWPVPAKEIETLRKLNGSRCLGVPQLLEHSQYGDHWYMVTERLGRPLSALFARIRRYRLCDRWDVLRTVGRMVVRRLQAIHEGGYMHNDVQPENILFGHSNCKSDARYMPYLIDFGTAQKLDGIEPLRRDLGSVDFNSIRSGRDIERRPHDDLEALGWTLLHGLFGELPWFELTRIDWSDHALRFENVKKVQAMKERFLKEGVRFLGESWKHLDWVPKEWREFMHLCQPTKYLNEMPRYDELQRLLGQGTQANAQDAEMEDLRQIQHALQVGFHEKQQSDYPDGTADVIHKYMQAMEKASAGQREQHEAIIKVMESHAVLEPAACPLWEVVGGADRGGIVVRRGRERDSPLLHSRLATGSVVEEEELDGERLSYNLVSGDGPNCGWVSIRIKYDEVVKELLVRRPDGEPIQRQQEAFC